MARILIVEDEYPINNLISKNLTLTGHECLSAYDGLHAIGLIQSMSLDLVILDVMLPGLSGFDLIKLIGDVPVIFVTAKSGLEDRLKGLSLGADDYSVKPFAMQELLARVSVVHGVLDKGDLILGVLQIEIAEYLHAFARGDMVDNDAVCDCSYDHYSTSNSLRISAIRIYLPFLTCLK